LTGASPAFGATTIRGLSLSQGGGFRPAGTAACGRESPRMASAAWLTTIRVATNDLMTDQRRLRAARRRLCTFGRRPLQPLKRQSTANCTHPAHVICHVACVQGPFGDRARQNRDGHSRLRDPGRSLRDQPSTVQAPLACHSLCRRARSAPADAQSWRRRRGRRRQL